MEIEFTECIVSEQDVILTARFIMTFQELAKEVQRSSHYDSIGDMVKRRIADKIAGEYAEKNKMSLVSAIKKEDIINGIQLKLIEGFTLQERR